MKKIALIILAAGKSSRIKGIKQLLKINNKTLLEISIEAARKSKSDAVFCVLGANAETIHKEIKHQNIEVIFNKNFEIGLSSSIVSAINYIEKKSLTFDAVLIMLADQPEVDTEYLNKLIEVYQNNSAKIITSKYNNESGVPTIFPKKYFKDLVLLKGDKGAKEFLKSYTSETIEVHRNSPLIDIDTQQEYESYIKTHLK